MYTLRDLGSLDSGCSAPGRYVMALDAGTTSVRAVIVDEYGCIVAQASRPIRMFHPQPGWAEQDPMEILASQLGAMMEVQVKSGIHSDSIVAIGISNQRETTVVWDRDSGQPICNAISWQCRRTEPFARQLADRGYADMIREKTGLTPDAYFSATKVRWVLDNVSGAREAARSGQLMCGTVDTWLIYNLTGGTVFATDYTNASRTMLFNIHTLSWDEELLDAVGIPRCMLPEVKSSSELYGKVSGEIMTHMPPIMGVAGDQQASLFGHCCFEPGEAKATYGTGCFVLMNTGGQVVESSRGLVSTVGIAQGGGVSYALEGSIFHAGSVMEWLRHDLGILESLDAAARVARQAGDNRGCYLVPAFSGLGAPWWDPRARGLICGLTAAVDRSTLVRAACESMAYQGYDVLRAMEEDSGRVLESLSVDGAASRNDFIMQFQSDVLGIPVAQSESVENTALGAAYLAGLACGYWSDREEIVQNRSFGARFEPTEDRVRMRLLVDGWHDGVARARTEAGSSR